MGIYKTTAIIQARNSSTRLPGKVLRKIQQQPLLWHIIERLKHSKSIDNIIVATSTAKSDDSIEFFCKKNKTIFFRGSLEDVLDRYYQTALLFEARIIVRITADCPIIDPTITDKVVLSFLPHRGSFDAASNIVKRTFPRGMDTEVLSFETLARLWRQAKSEKAREHPTLYMYNNPGKFKILSITNDIDRSNLRLTVDENDDLVLIRKIYSFLYKKDKIFLADKIYKLLEKRPGLLEINSNVKHKKITT